MDAHSFSLITTLILVFSAAIIGGMTARLIRVPMLLGYITAGVIFGNVFPRVTDITLLKSMGDIGVTLLLFTLGVEFSFNRLKKRLGSIVWASVAQLVLSIFIFLLLTMLLGFPFLASFIIAIAGSLSSTAVIVKVLSDRGEIDTVPGEVMTGWSIVQDLAVVPIMILLPSVISSVTKGDVGISTILLSLGWSIAKAVGALGFVVLLGKTIVPRTLSKVANLGSREIFILVTVGVVLLSSMITYILGLSAALGAFVAGLLISETSQNHAIFAEVRPLRDLFVVIFFVSIGMAIPYEYLLHAAGILIILTLMILLVKWGIVLGLMRFLGYHKKTTFLVALGLAQMSEFGFIIAQQGTLLGALSQEQYILLVALTFITILVSTPFFFRGNELYYAVRGWIDKYYDHTQNVLNEPAVKDELPYHDHIVLCGYGRVGKYIGRALEMADIPFIVVDYNNATITELKAKGIPVVYGDPADKNVLDYAQVDYAKAIIIAIPDRHTQELVIANSQTLNRRIKIICRTHHEEDQKHLKSLGVDAVIQPEFEAALAIVERLLPSFGVVESDIPGKISRLKIEHGVG